MKAAYLVRTLTLVLGLCGSCLMLFFFLRATVVDSREGSASFCCFAFDLSPSVKQKKGRYKQPNVNLLAGSEQQCPHAHHRVLEQLQGTVVLFQLMCGSDGLKFLFH